MDYLVNGVGIVGVTFVVVAYFLITNQKLTGQDWRFHALNFIGATLIMISLMVNWNTPSVIIETIWMAISGWGLWRCLQARKG
jgi:peptidoglycan/LPS O-acetylase OafA/YrhL